MYAVSYTHLDVYKRQVLNSAGPDAGAVWHYGDPLGEQRAAERGEAGMDLSHRPTFRITGPDRLTFLHAITSQDFRAVTPGEHVTAFMLDHTGRILAAFGGLDDGETFWAHTEPGRGEALVAEFNRLRFASKIEVELTPERAPVSYTHLDVYKRQDRTRGPAPGERRPVDRGRPGRGRRRHRRLGDGGVHHGAPGLSLIHI